MSWESRSYWVRAISLRFLLMLAETFHAPVARESAGLVERRCSRAWRKHVHRLTGDSPNHARVHREL